MATTDADLLAAPEAHVEFLALNLKIISSS